MTFYQELQLDQAGSKNYIAGFKKPKDKFIHILTYIFKVLINLIFCVAFVTLFSFIFGSENAITGLVVLLGVLTFRFTDLDIRADHSVLGIFIIFTIFAIGPKLANVVPLGCDICVNIVCILLIVMIGCHNVNWFNHSILVLSYLLLLSYDVSGIFYIKRLLCLLLGAVIVSIIIYHNNRKKKYECSFKNLFTDFSLSDPRSRWQIKIALCVSGAVLIAELIGASKPVWAGIAAMSVTVPRGDIKVRVESRIRGNVIGNIVFIGACLVVPANLFNYLGMLGGFCAGFCAKYEGQTAWNSFSAMTLAFSTLGAVQTVVFRILNNVLGALFAFLLGTIIEPVLLRLDNLLCKIKKKT